MEATITLRVCSKLVELKEKVVQIQYDMLQLPPKLIIKQVIENPRHWAHAYRPLNASRFNRDLVLGPGQHYIHIKCGKLGHHGFPSHPHVLTTVTTQKW